VPITWTAEGGGSVSEAVVETGEDGRSRVDRILGPAVGQQATLAHSDGLAGSPVIFVHTAVAGDASLLSVVSGNDQTAAVGSLLPQALVARLVDSQGNGVPNTAVTWVVATGGGTVSPENSTTDNDGYTSSQWTLGGILGGQRVDAVVSGVGVASFRATATAAAPASLFISTQPSASARNGVRLDRQPVIQLRDAQGNDVAAAGVQVAVSLGGGGELRGTIRRTTDASGRAAFEDLAISGAPGRRTLVFSAAGYAQVTSSEIELQAIGTTTTITGDSPDPSAVGSGFTVTFRVTSQGPTPTGSVTVSDGDQSCSGSLVIGAGSCQLALTTLGERTLTATYPGVPGLIGSSDTEAHTVVAPPPSNEAPDADYSWDCEALVCQFTDESEDDDGTIQGWSWDFGGAGTSIEQNPSHTFPGAGSYTVTLTVTDDDGSSDARSREVKVEAPPPPNQPPTAAFTWECDELECDFEDESSDSDGRIDSRSWDFGDGNTSNDRNPDHEYSSGGTYQVTLTVTDDEGAQGTVTRSVTAAEPNESPTAAFSESCSSLSCSFNAGGSTDPDGTIVGYTWNFGDGNTSNEANPSHTYASGGTYNVRLEVRDDDNTTDDLTRQVSVSVPNDAPLAAFTPPTCTAGEPCQFTDASTDDDGTIQGWNWDFGDGSTSSEQNPTHTYAASGPVDVSLTVTDDDGETNTVTHTVQVETAPEPSSLGILQQPSDEAESGRPFGRQPIIQLRDGSGGSLAISGVQVSAEVAFGDGRAISNDSTTDGSGRAVFTELAIDGEGEHRLVFTAAGFTSVVSDEIDVEEDD
jgi:PKD repeat protein